MAGTVAPRVGGRDVPALLDLLRLRFPAGVVRHGGIMVAAWWGVDPRGLVRVIRRTPDGQARHHVVRCAGTADEVGAAVSDAVGRDGPWSDDDEDADEAAVGFGRAVALMAREPDGTAHDVSASMLTFLRSERWDLWGWVDSDDAFVAAEARRDEIRAAVRPFTGTLDPEAVRFAARSRALDDGDWAGIDATFDAAVPLRRALERWPHLDRCVLAAWRAGDRYGWDVDPDAVRAAVTRHAASGLPRHVAAAVPAAHDRYVALLGRPEAVTGLTAPAAWSNSPITGRLSLLRHLPPSWVPCTDDEVDAFLEGAGALEVSTRLLRVAGVTGHREVARRLGVRGRWAAWIDGLAEVAGCARGNVGNAVYDVDDVAEAFASQVLTPLRARRLGVDVVRNDRSTMAQAAAVLLGNGGLRSLLRRSAAWHARSREVDDAVAALGCSDADRAAWPSLLPDAVVGDVEVRVLATARDLMAEGAEGEDASGAAGLSHCVGGYGPRCAAGTSRIVSLRRADTGERLSTAEFLLDRASRTATVGQHRGRRNAHPPIAAVHALRDYVGRTEARTLPWDALPSVPPLLNVSFDAGYDVTVPGAAERVLDAWRPFLPRAVRDLSADDLLATVPGKDGPSASASEVHDPVTHGT